VVDVYVVKVSGQPRLLHYTCYNKPVCTAPAIDAAV
jgi:hypothetical protein